MQPSDGKTCDNTGTATSSSHVFVIRGGELRVGTPVKGKLGDARVGSSSVALRVSKTPIKDSTFKTPILKNC
jgi:hypothetical protein